MVTLSSAIASCTEEVIIDSSILPWSTIIGNARTCGDSYMFPSSIIDHLMLMQEITIVQHTNRNLLRRGLEAAELEPSVITVYSQVIIWLRCAADLIWWQRRDALVCLETLVP